MSDTLRQSDIADMAASLDNSELGAAMRILARIASMKTPLDPSRAHVIAMMSRDEWEASRPAILDFFEVLDDGKITHYCLNDEARPPAETAPKRAQRTRGLQIEHPTRPNTVPGFPSDHGVAATSMKKTAFDMMIRLFKTSGLSENQARSVLSGLLKNWPEGAVFAAIEAATRERFLTDPRSWIIAHLKANATQLTRKTYSDPGASAPKPKGGKRQIASPQDMNLTQETTDTIRERNRGLSMNIKTGARK